MKCRKPGCLEGGCPEMCAEHWAELPHNIRVAAKRGHWMRVEAFWAAPSPVHSVLSVMQPWATLLVIGAKRYETRSRNFKHRGPLLIHASASTEYLDMAGVGPFAAALRKRDLPLGKLVGRVQMLDCVRTEQVALPSDDGGYEAAFGDFTPGRWALEMAAPEIFEVPVPAVGALGIWKWAGPLPRVACT